MDIQTATNILATRTINHNEIEFMKWLIERNELSVDGMTANQVELALDGLQSMIDERNEQIAVLLEYISFRLDRFSMFTKPLPDGFEFCNNCHRVIMSERTCLHCV